MSDRKWQAGEEQRKRKKLVSKGKLISGHFVSTRSQPSSLSSFVRLSPCVEYSRFFVHHPFCRASNPADPIIVSRKDRQRPRLHRRTRRRERRTRCVRSLAILDANETRGQRSFEGSPASFEHDDSQWGSIRHRSLVLLRNFRRCSVEIIKKDVLRYDEIRHSRL